MGNPFSAKIVDSRFRTFRLNSIISFERLQDGNNCIYVSYLITL